MFRNVKSDPKRPPNIPKIIAGINARRCVGRSESTCKFQSILKGWWRIYFKIC